MSENAISLRGITKTFGDHVAVRDLTLDIPRGSVFGLLGPNGAGKTTTLRMVMSILAPDAGSIQILGAPADIALRDRIGYQPEERGLYPRMMLQEQLIFLATIKGMPRKQAARRLPDWLERMGLADWAKRKTNELSKGMQQKAQFIAAVLHDPEILILDEPMSGLDPVGADLMRETLLELRRAGKTLVLSSHQMETVERLCDRVALIHRGEKVLDGGVAEIKASHRHSAAILAYEGDGGFLDKLPGVEAVRDFGRYVELALGADVDPALLLREAATRVRVTRFEIAEPSLHTIFVETVKDRPGETAEPVGGAA